MSIEAKGSKGVFAECPNCHASISHGFQVCQKCGHTVSAAEQQELRNSLKKNFARFAIIAFCCIAVVLYVTYQYAA
jgi:predicted nucleic acid-binding Zn ribbon protein